MYQYIYDSFLNDVKYSKILRVIENRLTDLGISGRIDRLSLFKDVREIIQEGLEKGVKTVVVVGNDETLIQVINAIPNFRVTLGIIPVGPNNKVTEILGIPQGEAACNILSSRRIKKIDLGKINSHYFLSSVEIPPREVALKCNKSFYIKSEEKTAIKIYNLPLDWIFYQKKYSSPQDGLLEVFINPGIGLFGKFLNRQDKFARASVFPFKTLSIKSKESLSLLVDQTKTVTTPAEIKIVSQRLKMIVGKRRAF